MESSDNEDDSGASGDISKRKLAQFEDPSVSSFKKARYSWQVKGSKGKYHGELAEDMTHSGELGMTSAEVISNSSENVTSNASGSNSGDRIRPQSRDEGIRPQSVSNATDEKLFHEMDFDPPCESAISSQRSVSPLNQAVLESLQQNETDYNHPIGNSSNSKSNSVAGPARIKQVQTSLHACFLTARPSSSNVLNTTIPLDNPLTIPAFPRRFPVPVTNPNNVANNALSNEARDGIEFRDALRSMHRSNLSAYEKWQKRNTAGAIVDNVFNRTLEEMGVSPDAAVNRRSLDRNAVEDQSILAAINSQGLTANRENEEDSVETRSEEESAEFDYLRQNRDVFDKTFERLGYFRYDIIHQRNPDIQSPGTNTELRERQMEETATQTEDNFVSGQLSRAVAANSSCEAVSEGVDNKSKTASSTDEMKTDMSEKDLNVDQELNAGDATVMSVNHVRNLSASQENSVLQEKSDDSRETKCSNDSVTKEKDIAVNENVLNLALSAAIQSQGLTFK